MLLQVALSDGKHFIAGRLAANVIAFMPDDHVLQQYDIITLNEYDVRRYRCLPPSIIPADVTVDNFLQIELVLHCYTVTHIAAIVKGWVPCTTVSPTPIEVTSASPIVAPVLRTAVQRTLPGEDYLPLKWSLLLQFSAMVTHVVKLLQVFSKRNALY
jgi:hypothetical protein